MSGPTIPPPFSPMPYAQVYPSPSSDLQHLKILAICHWVFGGMLGLFACLGILYLVIGIVIFNQTKPATTSVSTPPATVVTRGNGSMNVRVNATATRSSSDDDRTLGIVFTSMGSAFIVLGGVGGGLNLYSGFGLLRQRRRRLSLVVAALDCLSIPLGTVLGIFTMIVLARATVKTLYQTAPETRHGRP